jgi:hypothetical protein
MQSPEWNQAAVAKRIERGENDSIGAQKTEEVPMLWSSRVEIVQIA